MASFEQEPRIENTSLSNRVTEGEIEQTPKNQSAALTPGVEHRVQVANACSAHPSGWPEDQGSSKASCPGDCGQTAQWCNSKEICLKDLQLIAA